MGAATRDQPGQSIDAVSGPDGNLVNMFAVPHASVKA